MFRNQNQGVQEGSWASSSAVSGEQWERIMKTSNLSEEVQLGDRRQWEER